MRCGKQSNFESAKQNSSISLEETEYDKSWIFHRSWKQAEIETNAQ